MNIVFGGSFNPPTNAHEKIVNLLLEKFNNSKVIILPVGNSYNKPSLISFEDRYQMLKLIFGSNERVVISKLEKDKAFDGTIKSLDSLSEQFENLVFVMGADNLEQLHTWIEYERLIKTYPLILIERNEKDLKQLVDKHPLLKKYDLIKFNEEISSSIIRENVNLYKHLLNEDVYKYIENKSLYEVNNND